MNVMRMITMLQYHATFVISIILLLLRLLKHLVKMPPLHLCSQPSFLPHLLFQVLSYSLSLWFIQTHSFPFPLNFSLFEVSRCPQTAALIKVTTANCGTPIYEILIHQMLHPLLSETCRTLKELPFCLFVFSLIILVSAFIVFISFDTVFFFFYNAIRRLITLLNTLLILIIVAIPI